jgi:serine protease Do
VARAVIVQLREEGRVRRAYLGVQLHELDPDLAGMMGLREARGALVVDVPEGQAAAAAGLRRWDVITGVAGEPIADGDELVQTISALPPGREVRLSLLRDGEALTVSARLGERVADAPPEPGQVRPAVSTPTEGDALGLIVGALGASTRAELRLPPDRVGVAIRSILGVDPGTDVLEEGDLVVSVNRRATPDVMAYREVLGSLRPGQSAWLYIHRPMPSGSFLTRIEVERSR